MRLCKQCASYIYGRGERIKTRPMTEDDLTDYEYESEEAMCDWCDEIWPMDDMVVSR